MNITKIINELELTSLEGMKYVKAALKKGESEGYLPSETHVHTENSRFDSATNVRKMVTRAKEMGIKLMALTEHGVLTSFDSFENECRDDNPEREIIPVMGIEAYVKPLKNSPEGRSHACFYAKSDKGKKVLRKAITDSYLYSEKGIPIFNSDIILKYFAKGSEGYNEVIMTSACISGIISNILQMDVSLPKKIGKLQEKIRSLGYSPVSEDALNEIETKFKNCEKQISLIEPISKKKYKARENALKKMNEKDRSIMKMQLDEEKAETEKAIITLKELKAEKKMLSKEFTQLKNAFITSLETKEKADEILAQIKEYESILNSDLYERAKKTATSYQKLLGEGNFYLELQYHGMPEEEKIMPLIAKISNETGIPVVAANDAHMDIKGEDSTRARSIIRSLRYVKETGMWIEPTDIDRELYLKSDEELAEWLLKILDKKTVVRAIFGKYELLNKCQYSNKNEDHFPKAIPEIAGESSEACLRRKVHENISWRYPDGIDELRKNRIENELNIMCSMGFADYHLIVQDYMEYARYLGKIDFNNLPKGFEEHKYDKKWLKNITKDSSFIGLGVGPGRGSAAGSIVCYILGITDLDPITYGLLFERFLNPERVSMPDIDCDIATHIREMVYDYVSQKYGNENVCHIMTKGCLQAKNSIENCGKLLGDCLYGDKKHFSSEIKVLKSMVNDGQLPERQLVEETFSSDKEVLRIYDDACLVNGVFKDYGMHAAGVVISDGVPVKEYIPLMLDADTGILKTQCTMTQVEESHKLLKMDFLGLNTLDIITDTLYNIRQTTGKNIDIDNIPFEPDVFKKIYSNGFTNGVFQVESNGMKDMMKQARPKNIEDVIILISMYRPGPMDSLPELIKVMTGKKKPVYKTPLLKPILENTYGTIVYQEEVMQIVRDLAGYSYGRSDLVRRAMSKKKADVMEREKTNFVYGNEAEGIKGCIANGIPEDIALEIWNDMADFAKYAFNKSHAAAYAIVSYRTAWLKYHYPTEFITAFLNHIDGGDKEKKISKIKGFVSDLKSLNIPFMAPDINKSDSMFSIKSGGIYFGLSKIMQVGNKAELIVAERKENGPYKSIADFIYRTQISGNILGNLIKSGAFDKIINCSREAAYDAVKDIAIVPAKDRVYDVIKVIKDKTKTYIEADTDRKKENAIKALEGAKDVLNTLHFDNSETDSMKELLNEKDVLGIMVSGHPSKDFDSYMEMKCIPLSELSPMKYGSVMGQIVDLRIVRRKSDGKEMAFFSLDMPDGCINVCCFASEYQKYSKNIVENNMIKISGSISEVDACYDDESDKTMQIIAKEVIKLSPKKKNIIVYGDKKTKEEWLEFRERISIHEEENGYPLILFNLDINKFQDTGLFVSKTILNDTFFKSEIA